MDFVLNRLPRCAQIFVMWASLTISSVRAAGAEFVAPAAPQLDEILVVGEHPGPAMWRVSRGEHSLYILATLAPLPKDMVWRSHSVEDRIAASQLVLAPPDVSAHVGFFRSLTLVPSLLRARHDPEGRTLEQSLPHELSFAGWRCVSDTSATAATRSCAPYWRHWTCISTPSTRTA